MTYQTNTLANPRAVMVKLFNAVVADRAVGTARRPVEHAGVAVLDLEYDSIQLYFLDAREPQLRSLASSCVHVAVKRFRLWRMSVSRDDSWISSGCKQQKDYILRIQKAMTPIKHYGHAYSGHCNICQSERSVLT